MEPRENPRGERGGGEWGGNERLWKLLDHHPRLKSDPAFAERVARAAALESRAHDAAPLAPFAPRRARPTLRRAVLFAGAALAAAALFLLWIWTPSGSGDEGRASHVAPPLADRIDAPPEELLRELELLRDLDLLEGRGAARDLAVLLDVSDLELLDRARALWEEEAAGGD